jgi:hypothetical protein
VRIARIRYQFTLILKSESCLHERRTIPNMIAHITGWDAKLAAVAQRALRHVRGEEMQRPSDTNSRCRAGDVSGSATAVEVVHGKIARRFNLMYFQLRQMPRLKYSRAIIIVRQFEGEEA